jgi:2-keto-4-pentenoate hydratase/2-oxohepta-3-ene-1,7-dioic acid hydratase in catechol pathway
MITGRRGFLSAAAGTLALAGCASSQQDLQIGTVSMGARGGPQPLQRDLTYATIATSTGWGLGIRTERGVLDVSAAEEIARTGAPVTMTQLIAQEGDLRGLTKLATMSSTDLLAKCLVPEDEVRFGPVVTDPPKILCIGLNYRAHVAEAGEKLPTTPIFFNKFSSSLNAHRGAIRVSREHAHAFDYEAEMVVVIGLGGRDIPEERALDHVLGYAVGQDFSARDLQMATSQWMMGKAGDGWGPIGPWLVGADLVDPQKLDIQCRVNGELRQSSNTSRMIFDVRQQIAYLSRNLTLEPGDVIFTGTPEGVIIGYPKDKQVWLKAGDRITTTIQHLGTQEVVLV